MTVKIKDSLQMIYNIAKTELKTLFYSPIAWLILLAFTIQATLPFIDILERYTQSREMYPWSSGSLTNPFFLSRGGIFETILTYLYLFIPLLTMGLMSREISSGSIKLLFSSPISSRQIVFGKFFAMMIFAAIMVIPILIFVTFSNFIIKDFDLSMIMTGVLGIYLLICAYSAIGLFMSSLTSYQVVAAIGTIAVLGVLNFIGQVGQEIDFVRDLTYWLSITGRAKTMTRGLISSEGILYFISVIGMFLSFTIIKFQSGKLKNKLIIAGRYSLIVASGLLIGYISSRPSMKLFWDTTSTKTNTLTKNSQDIINKIDDDLTITTYVNLFHTTRHHGMPRYINQDKERFEQYLRFKPDIKMKYVYYYDKNPDPKFYRNYNGMTDRQIGESICKIWKHDIEMFKTPEEIKKIENLWPEGNRFVRTIERSNGRKTFLRIFKDMFVHPGETEIAAALNRLVDDVPKVGFLTGHGERSVYKYGDRDYGTAAGSKTFRNALINQGFDYTSVNIAKGEIPEDISILVIADMKKEFSEAEYARIKKYIDKGGNILLSFEPKRRKQMKRIADMLGIKLTDGVMVRNNDSYIPTLTAAYVTKQAYDTVSYKLGRMFRKRLAVTMPTAVSLDCSACKEKGFTVTDVLLTKKKGAWNELETKDFIDDVPVVNKKIGEVEKSHVMSAVLTRNINNRQQRIIVFGDADWMSNSEMEKRRKGIKASNFTFYTGVFNYLSDGKMPVDVRRPAKTDTKLYFKMNQFDIWKIIFLWLIPIGIIVSYLMIWLNRFKK